MNADGPGQTRLTDTPEKELDPDFSPDGSRIAYTSTPGGVESIWVMNSDGSNPRRLTNGLSESRPEWMRDGRRIAYVSRNNTSIGIYVMNSDGSGQMPLSNPLIETDNFDLR